MLCIEYTLFWMEISYENLVLCKFYRQESYFAYLFGVKEPDFYGAIVSSQFLMTLSTKSGFLMQICLDSWYRLESHISFDIKLLDTFT